MFAPCNLPPDTSGYKRLTHPHAAQPHEVWLRQQLMECSVQLQRRDISETERSVLEELRGTLQRDIQAVRERVRRGINCSCCEDE